MTKRILSLALALVLALALSVPALASNAPFSQADLPPGWSFNEPWTNPSGNSWVCALNVPASGQSDGIITNQAFLALLERTGVGFGTVDNRGWVFYHDNWQGGTTSTTQTPAATTTPAPSTSTPTARTENDVLVAGQYRTPGQIHTLRSGENAGGYLYTVNHGDTLYDLTARFYGNGNLWRELQKVNQEYLNQTKDGIIFVGFNMLLPAQLGDVRVNIG